MEIRVLKYFLAVAREQSISKAAEVLHITQPPLSRQIKELEEELGKQLFIRGSRKITLTEDGMILRRRAEEMLQLMDKTIREIGNPDEEISGEVYIGAGETEGMRIAAKAIHSLQENYPNIVFHLFSGNAYDVSEKLDNGLLDFGVLIEPVDVSKYDYIKLPPVDTWGILMRQDHPLAKKKSITFSDLEGQKLIVSEQAVKNNELTGWFGQKSRSLKIAATYNLIFNASLLVEENVGVALTLDKIIHESDTLCFRPLEPKTEVGMVLVWKKYQMFTKAAEKFLEEISKI